VYYKALLSYFMYIMFLYIIIKTWVELYKIDDIKHNYKAGAIIDVSDTNTQVR
jgi:hypothetical protein